MIIRQLIPSDWPAVKQIYEDGIATGNATFQPDAPPWDAWDVAHDQTCRLVAVGNEGVVGWAALSPVSSRPVYAGVAEVSVYVAARARRSGVGRLLLNSLIAIAEDRGYWTLQAGIFPENVASVQLHRGCGFRVVGIREKLGRMNAVWRDVLLLERRSAIAGFEG
jgi:L-amino acid N-acyltransferase YncA